MEKVYKVEFHVHTRGSKDSILNKYLLLLICKIRKIDCVAITDHNEIYYALKCKELFKKFGINVIVGEEIFSQDGEIIGLYLNKKIEKGLSSLETIKRIKKQGGIVYIPHPFEPYRKDTVLNEDVINKEIKDIDCIEIHNGRNRKDFISDKQFELCRKYALTPVIGSDAHTFFEVGRNCMFLSDIGRDKILLSIKKCNQLQKSKCIAISHIFTKVARVIKIIEKGDIHELRRIINKKIGRCR